METLLAEATVNDCVGQAEAARAVSHQNSSAASSKTSNAQNAARAAHNRLVCQRKSPCARMQRPCNIPSPRLHVFLLGIYAYRQGVFLGFWGWSRLRVRAFYSCSILECTRFYAIYFPSLDRASHFGKK